MRVALVSPYSASYPGGVGRHVEALAEQFLDQGHDVRVLAPHDPDDRLARLLHRGQPDQRPMPDHHISLGRSCALPMNGSQSRIAITPYALGVLGRELRHGNYDVVHVHELNAPIVSWYAAEAAPGPLVATLHTYTDNKFSSHLAATVLGARRLYNKAHVKIAVSEASRWTQRRFYGGRYRVIPNGVDLSAALPGPKPVSDHVRLLFFGRAEQRKGLPVALRAFEALRGTGVDARLIVAGATREEVEPYLLDDEGVEIAGRVSDEEKWRLMHEADLLVAPSLGGESFGMVLTEAFASGTPVVASDIAGYRDVVRDGEDGILVRAGDPAAVGEALHALATNPARRERMGVSARERAERFAWPRVSGEVMDAYSDAIRLHADQQQAIEAGGRRERVLQRAGLRPADGMPVIAPQRLASIEPSDPLEPSGRSGKLRVARKAAVFGGAAAGIGLTYLALQRIGTDQIVESLVAATPVWVLAACALMCISMLVRAEAWTAILRAALPAARVRRRDAARGVMVGVLMSATLPARLGEPSRALIVARRLGRVRERLPIVLGTLISQTLLNLVALAVLGSIMFATVGLFQGREDALIIATIAPVVVIALLLTAPALLRSGKPSRFRRVQQALSVVRGAMMQARLGLQVFRQPKLGSWAVLTQLFAWFLQWIACYALLVALGLDHRAGLGAAAAVLFAVNVTAALPATPSNIGVFQAACVAVLSAYHVNHTDALAYGIILQAVEIATALAMGMPALVAEGLTWKDLRLRAMHTSPVELAVGGRSRSSDGAEVEA
ncbi:MAG: phosphatidyl-myo-inositol alpha-mannosyltransferase [Thermoleophilaceae bacterium]|nr:phosphatidyl-myo-inositol alpha-mannosyltransferase [Thermoleophilaceae bacterium]